METQRHYLTDSLPGTGGKIKVFPEDFRVEEIPLYTPCGQGDHTYITLEKRGIGTLDVVHALARALNLPPAKIGYAGLKDAHAVTVQTLSVERVPPERIAEIDLPNVRILHIDRHTNRLKLGHLKGNRFVIRIREVVPDALERACAILAILSRRGVPNRFGPQRFGLRGNNHRLGRALVRKAWGTLIAELLGSPHPQESPTIQEARRLFEAGEWEQALALFPPSMREERAILHALIRSGGNVAKAAQRLSRVAKQLYLSAYQAYLFNRIVDLRLDTLDRLMPGDLAYLHDRGAVFLVEDPTVEQPRADRWEISPSGPLYGHRILLAEGEPGQIERQVLEEEGITPEEFRIPGIKMRGARRPLRFPIHDLEVDQEGSDLILHFSLPAGCYATVLLAEITKADDLG